MIANLISKVPPAMRQAAAYGFALVAAKAVSLMMVPVYTHYLVPADYGRLDVLQTLANVLSIVIAFGLSQSLFRFAGAEADEGARRRIAAGIFGTSLLLGVVSLVVTQATAPMITQLLPGGVTELQTRLILGSLAVTGMILVPMSWLRMRDKALLYMCASAGYAAVQAALSAIMLILGYGIDGVLAAGLAAASVLSIVLLVLQVRDSGIRFDREGLGRNLHFGGVMVFSGLAAFIMDSFDRWLLADAIGPAEMAMYALAAKIGLIAAVACQPFEMWWLPRRFRVLNEEGGEVRCARATEIGLVVAMMACVGVAASGPLVITIMTPASYHGAIQYVPWLCGLAVLAASTKLLNTGCLSREGTTWPIAIDGGAAALALGLYMLLIPMYGGFGAIAATVVVLALRILAYLIVGARVRTIQYRFVPLAILASLTVIGLAFVAAIPGIALPLMTGGLSALLIGFCALAFGLLPRLSGLRMRPMVSRT